MKILHVITSLETGGAEKLMVDLLPRFKSMGYVVDLLLFDGTRTPFYEELEKAGIKIYFLSVGGNVYNPVNLYKLKKYLTGYDIIHTHNTACQFYVPFALNRNKHKCKLVTTEHNTYNRRRNIPLFRHIDKIVYQQYNSIIAISSKAAENLKAFIGENFQIDVINNGIDLSLYNNDIVFPTDDVIITMIAGFRPQKDQDTLIRAITHLPDRYKLWLVGDGERRQTIEKMINDFDLQNRVKLMGNRNDIPNILSNSHITVLSSHWEGLSLSSIEGMASGRPFIASDVDGLHDIVAGAGILFPHGNDITLANEIRKLCESPEEYIKVASSCQQRANNFDINFTAKKYLDLYTHLYV